MRAATFTYHPTRGWSLPDFPELTGGEQLIVVFGAPEYRDDAEPLKRLIDAYPRAHIVGCSTAGEIDATSVGDGRLVVAACSFERTTLRSAMAEIAGPEGSYAAGRSLARALEDAQQRALFVLSDGLNVNGSELVRGINSVVGPDVVVTGGLAGDGSRFEHTWVLHGGEPRERCVTGVGFYGDAVVVGHGSKGGWDIFGPERCVTRSAGNKLYELDGRPALELYKSYLGELASGLPATGLLFPLSLRAGEDAEIRLVRTILAVDEGEQSLTFAGDVPEGSLAQLMRANFDRLISGAEDAARVAASDGAADSATLALAISCVGRRLVLGERTEEEVEATMEVLPGGAGQIGFYSYGEISPYTSGSCDLHNQTMTLTTISER